MQKLKLRNLLGTQKLIPFVKIIITINKIVILLVMILVVVECFFSLFFCLVYVFCFFVFLLFVVSSRKMTFSKNNDHGHSFSHLLLALRATVPSRPCWAKCSRRAKIVQENLLRPRELQKVGLCLRWQDMRFTCSNDRVQECVCGCLGVCLGVGGCAWDVRGRGTTHHQDANTTSNQHVV